MAEASSQTSDLTKTAAPASKQGSQTSKTEEAAGVEVPSTDEKADEPKEEAKKEEVEKEEAEKEKEPAASSSKIDARKLKKSGDKITASTPSLHSNVSQQEVTVNQLVAEYLPRSLNEISDEELVGIIINLEHSITLMKIENEIFESYMTKIDPALMEDFNERLENLIARSRYVATKRPTSGSASSRGSTKRDNPLALLESGPRITLTTKSDILDKQIVLVEESLNQFHVEMEHAHAVLKATEEEAGILTQETLDAINKFERMCTYSVDPVSGCIPAEKFMRYLQEWFKNADSTIEKLRLHTNTMHQSVGHMKRVIQECKDLGYTIQPIDFDQMEIENRLLKETLGMKNKHLLELKYLAGKCSLVLVQHKKKLMQQESQGHKLIDKIEMLKGNIREVEKVHEVTKHKLKHAEPKLIRLREFIDTHECPDVMEYIKTIDEVHRLKQDIHKWERRHGIQNLNLVSSSHKMQTSSFQSETNHQSESSFTSRSDTQEITEESYT